MDIVEMDELISERQGMSIPEIFEKHGEEYFRNLETNLLIELQKASRTIISCGGGAAMRSQNVSEMKKKWICGPADSCSKDDSGTCQRE